MEIYKKTRRLFSVFVAKVISNLIRFWRTEKFVYSPEEWRQMRISFTDMGEDLIVLDFFHNSKFTKKGIYIDAGAFDPVLISNTMLLYKNGWRGINIDANPNAIINFNNIRPYDINVCVALSESQEIFHYIEYAVPGNNRLVLMNSPDEESMMGELPIKKTIVHSKTLTEILKTYLNNVIIIDFLSIDCEGYDLQILRGLDFQIYRPRLICVEHRGRLCAGEDEFLEFLTQKKYDIYAKLPGNTIFKDMILD